MHLCCIPALAAIAVFVFLPAVQHLSSLFQKWYSTLLPEECAAQRQKVCFWQKLKKPTLRKCTGLPDRNFLLKLQNLANWSKHVVIVIIKNKNKTGVSETKLPIGSLDHHFSSAWSVSWQHFFPATLYIVTFRALCWLLSKSFWLKKAKPAWTGGWQVSWRSRWIKSVGADRPL